MDKQECSVGCLNGDVRTWKQFYNCVGRFNLTRCAHARSKTEQIALVLKSEVAGVDAGHCRVFHYEQFVEFCSRLDNARSRLGDCRM